MLSSARIVYCAFTIASLLHSTFVQPTLATSSPRPPLARAAHPVVQSLDVFPRHGQAKHRRDTASATLLHTDSLRVTLTAYDQTYHLHLKPNEELVHPAARINYYRNGPNGRSELFKTAPLRRESVRAYHGEVVRADDKEQASRRFNEDVAGGLFRRYDTPAPANVRGWARIMIHSEGDPATGTPPTLEGAFSVDGDIHHVATYETYMRTKRPGDPLPPPPKDPADGGLVVFRNSDFEAVQANPAKSCTHDQLAWNSDPRVNPALRAPTTTPSSWYDSLLPSNLTRRQNDVGNGDISNNYISTIGQTDGCPKTQQIVYMGVAADCRYVATYENQDGATRRILENFNTATAQYKSTFNVSLGIVELNIHEAACPPTAPADAPWNVDCSTNIPLNERLSLFSQWRGQRSDNIGLWHLMSGCPTGTEVGVAWLSTLCMQTSSGEPGTIVSGTAVSTAGPTEWEVVTHEVGHNFGAIHDCTDGCTLTDLCCPSSATACLNPTEQFIMNPLSSTRERDFSPCSIGNICTGLQNSLNRTCLQDASAFNQNTISLQMCGNGIVEEGEECDPGQGASSECCDSTTCRFRAGAVCDPASSACCTQQCQFASSGTVCRPAMDGRCDVAETCTGTSAQCPADSTQPNGKQCGTEFGETLTCASGICTSVGQQCRLMGSSLNLTRECSQRSMTGCQVSCQDPRNAGRCLVLQATLPNGSPCGFGGTCQGNGECVSGTALNTVKAWYLQNLQISIPVTVVAGIILLLILWGIFGWLRRCCASRRSRRAASNAANQDYIAPPVVAASAVPRRMVPPAFGQRPDSQEGLLNGGPVSVPPQAHSRTRSPRGGSDLTRNPYALTPPRHGSADMNNSRPGWVDDTMYNGPRRR